MSKKMLGDIMREAQKLQSKMAEMQEEAKKKTVEATAGEVFGDKNIKLLDTRYPGPGTTDFSFSWAPGDSLEAPQVYISIQVSTPEYGNGYQSRNIVGTKMANP